MGMAWTWLLLIFGWIGGVGMGWTELLCYSRDMLRRVR